MNSADPKHEDVEQNEFVQMTAAEAERWRAKNPNNGVGWALKAQCLAGAVAIICFALLQVYTGENGLVQSSFYGALVVVVPSWVSMRGMTSKFGGHSVSASVIRFFVWEFAKIGLSIAMLMMAPRVLGESLSWLALIVSLIVAFKGFWVFVFWQQWAQARCGKA